MLFAPVGCLKPIRVQGAFVSDSEVEAVTDFLKSNCKVEYDKSIIDDIEREAARCGEKKRVKPIRLMIPQASEISLTAMI